MYYFIGLVTDKSMKSGGFKPSYVLADFDAQTSNRAPWRVVKIGGALERQRRVLATSLIGNDLMIDFMSYWRALVPQKRASRKTKFKRVYIHGALFFFECDRRGNPTGRKIFIKRVPDRQGRFQEDNLIRYLSAENKKPPVNELFAKAPFLSDLRSTGVKPFAVNSGKAANEHKTDIQNQIKHSKERNEHGKQLIVKRRIPRNENRQRERAR